MLDGLTLDADPLLQNVQSIPEPETIYEDEWLVIINKPAGMLSVPGKSDSPSVYDLMKKRYPDATGPMIVHRLDMSTSGLLIVTKHKEVHKIMQARFKERSVRKRYIALLEGTIATTSGIVDLPIRPDLLDRPRQIADPVNGKKALTRYNVLECDGKRTRIALYPLTGRTHQLRVHCAHPLGLNTPICGDELYGRADQRLFLHAESLRFDHPVTGKEIRITTHPDF